MIKKLLTLIAAAVVLGIICGYVANYVRFLGVEENFQYWSTEHTNSVPAKPAGQP